MSVIQRFPNLTRRFFASVAAGVPQTDTYTPANGEVVDFMSFGGAAAYSEDIHVEIYWDKGGAAEKLLFSTHGDAEHKEISDCVVTGDGTKKIEIVLENHLVSGTHPIGGFWTAEKR